MNIFEGMQLFQTEPSVLARTQRQKRGATSLSAPPRSVQP